MILLDSIRDISLQRDPFESSAFRQAMVTVTGKWDFQDNDYFDLISTSLNCCSVLRFDEICDVLAYRWIDLVASHDGVITSICDMAAEMGAKGEGLLDLLASKFQDLGNIALIPYLATRRLALCSRAEVTQQRTEVFAVMEQFSRGLRSSFESLTALSLVSHYFVEQLRLSERPLSNQETANLLRIDYLCDEVLEQIEGSKTIPPFVNPLADTSSETERILCAFGEIS